MARYRGRDDVDEWCDCWAYQWVALFLRNPRRAREYIGPLNCTLGRVRELHDGASSNTEHVRSLPEGFLGVGLVVAVALRYMDATHREMIGAHYLARVYDLDRGERLKRPVKVQVIANRMGLSPAEYANRRDVAKGMIRAAFNLDPKDLAQARGQGLEVAHL